MRSKPDQNGGPGDAPPAADAEGCWRFADVRFDERSLQLTVQGVEASAPRKSLRVLQELLRHAGEVVTKDELIENCWPGRILSDSVLTTTVGRLREALADNTQALIQTVKGHGYRLAVPVSFDGPAPPPAARLTLKVGDHPPQRPHWRLTGQVGSGGQADVWLGADASGAQAVFKFALERRALAALKREVAIGRLLSEVVGEGAGFVCVLDWNFDDQPGFIVSEHIAGGNLEQWVQARGGLATLDLALRIELAAQCAEALAAAHTAGVLHKDLKPANVLVDDIGPKPRIRLCDFGSAAVLDRERLQRFALTRMGVTQARDEDSSSGTPLYMAPEMLAGQSATERGDVYALGVLLYQFVVGDFRRPLAPGWEAGVADEGLREDIALAAAGDPLRRLVDASGLARRLRSLPARREQRAAERREALRAAALQKQLERHRQRRPLVIGLGVMLLAGLATASVLSWHLRAALDEARRQTEVATAVNDFVQKDLLAGADPGQAGKPDPSMREVLKTAEAKVGERFAGQPLQQGAVLTTLGTAWHLIGNDADAEADLRQAIAVLEPLGDSARLETARAHLALGRNLSIRGIEEYAQHFDRAAALAARGSDLASWKVGAQVRLARARIPGWSGQYMQALALLEPLYKETAARLPADDPLRVKTRLEEVGAMAGAGRTAEALAAARELIPYLERGRSKNLGDAAELHRSIAQTLERLNQPQEAEAEARRALRILETARGADDPEALNVRKLLAVMKLHRGQVDEGIAELRALLAPTRANQGELGYSVSLMLVITDAMTDAGRWQGAEADARAALKESQTVSADQPEMAALANTRLAYVLWKLGRRDEAAPLFESAMPVIHKALEPANPYAIRATRQYQEFLGDTG